MRALFIKFVVLLGLTQTVQSTVWSAQPRSTAMGLNMARFNAVDLKGKSGQKPVQQLSNAWKPMCLSQLGKRASKRPVAVSHTMLTDRDMTIFSNPELSGNRSPNGTLSLKGLPSEYLAILSTSAQNSSALMQNYAGVSGGMDLFGIRAMFVSPLTNSITSDFGPTDSHRFV